jgi:ribosomal protein S18 acetylase RimI-like enzyme
MNPLSPPLRWREAEAADQPFLDALFLTSRDDLQLLAGNPALPQILRQQQHAQDAWYRQTYPEARRWLIERDAAAIGQATVHLGLEEVRLLDIAVAPLARRTGAARAVIAALQHEAAQRGVPLRLSVQKTNLAARTLYLAMGLRVQGQDLLMEQMAWTAAEAAP